MTIKTTHPEYAPALPLWQLCRDCYAGENTIKAKTTQYLPYTAGMMIDGVASASQPGSQRYNSYIGRAVFPEVMTDTIGILVGILNRKEASIQLPTALEPLRDKASILNESLSDILRKIHEQQLITGRVGIHADVPQRQVQIANLTPLLSLYNAETIINWDDGEAGDPTRQVLQLVVLNETEPVRNGFTWTTEEKYRVLVLGETNENESTPAVYRSAQVSEGQTITDEDLMPVLLRGQTLDVIPFVFVGPTDIDIKIDQPPLLGLANRSLAIYRGEADLRASLFLTGQDTLVTIGDVKGDIRIGAGARIPLPLGGDAKFIGIDSRGIEFQIRNLSADYEIANALSARLVQRGSAVESGDALRIRVAAQTASLTSVARASAAALQEILRMSATWLGADPEEVFVTPNLDFADDPLEASELLDLLTFKQRGGILSHRTMNDIMKRRDLVTRTIEEEIEEIETEDTLIPEDIRDMAALSLMNPQSGPFGMQVEEEEPPTPAPPANDDE